MSSVPRRFSIRLPRPLWIGVASGVLIVAVVGLQIGLPVYRHWRQQVAIAEIHRRHGIVLLHRGGPGWLRRWLGDERMNVFDTAEHVELSCEEYPVTDADLVPLESLIGVEQLMLDGTVITDAGLERLRGMTTLNELVLGKTQVTDDGLERLQLLTSLEQLDLRETRITDAGLKHLQHLKSLQYLHLNHSRVTDAGLSELRCLPNLKVVSLDDCAVTDAGLECLRGFTALEGIGLSGTRPPGRAAAFMGPQPQPHSNHGCRPRPPRPDPGVEILAPRRDSHD
jgi:hypothetical protein